MKISNIFKKLLNLKRQDVLIYVILVGLLVYLFKIKNNVESFQNVDGTTGNWVDSKTARIGGNNDNNKWLRLFDTPSGGDDNITITLDVLPSFHEQLKVANTIITGRQTIIVNINKKDLLSSRLTITNISGKPLFDKVIVVEEDLNAVSEDPEDPDTSERVKQSDLRYCVYLHQFHENGYITNAPAMVYLNNYHPNRDNLYINNNSPSKHDLSSEAIKLKTEEVINNNIPSTIAQLEKQLSGGVKKVDTKTGLESSINTLRRNTNSIGMHVETGYGRIEGYKRSLQNVINGLIDKSQYIKIIKTKVDKLTHANRGNRLVSNKKNYIGVGEYIMSDNKRFVCGIRVIDGLLICYDRSKKRIYWPPKSAHRALSHGNQLHMQGDGNLVLYRYKGAPWATGARKSGVYTLLLQSDGNLVIYGPNYVKGITGKQI